MRLLVILLLTLAFLPCEAAVQAYAGDTVVPHNGKGLREAVQQNKIVSLVSIMEWLEARYEGTIVEVELEFDEKHDALIYEVDLVTPAGAKLEFDFDAHSGKLLEIDGRNPEAARKPSSPRP